MDEDVLKRNCPDNLAKLNIEDVSYDVTYCYGFTTKDNFYNYSVYGKCPLLFHYYSEFHWLIFKGLHSVISCLMFENHRIAEY